MRIALCALLLALSGCVTVPIAPAPPPNCANGDADACITEAEQALTRGDKDLAIADYGHACDGGRLEACRTQGRMLMERGNLDAAEAPLVHAQQQDTEDARTELAALYEARRKPGDLQRAQALRYDALAIDQPDAEVTAWYRVAPLTGDSGIAAAINVQPMGFYSRRLAVGALFATTGIPEFDGYVGYQHFFTDWLILYGHALGGVLLAGRSEVLPTYGAELGLKATLGPIGHLDLNVGTSRGSPFYVSVGLGIHWLLALEVLARM